MASLQSRLSDLITAVGADIKQLLKTTGYKTTLFARTTATIANSTTTPAPITPASGSALSVTVEAGKTYEIEVRGSFRSAATTTGIGFRLNGTATATRLRYDTIVGSPVAANTIWYVFTTLAPTIPAGAISAGVVTNGLGYPFWIRGIIVVNAGGTLFPEFISEVASSAVTIDADAYMIVRELVA